jgi:hypothetical protein
MTEHGEIRQLIQSLPEDVPSMAWRSQLNERVLVESTRLQKRRKLVWWSRPAAGFAVAGALAVMFLSRVTIESNSASDPASFESALVSAHREAQVSVTDISLTSFEADQFGESLPSQDGWTDNDLEGI